MGKPRSVFSNRDVIDTFRNQQKIAAYERRNNTKVNLPGLSKDKKSGELKVTHRYSSIEKYEESKKA